MKDLTLRIFDKYALPSRNPRNHIPREREAGIFVMPSCVDGGQLRIVATAHLDWDHVSISRHDRCPDWYEMEQVKRLFFWPHETAMQLHVPPDEHVNNSEHCLHIWRPQKVEIPRPPSLMVGIASATPDDIKALRAGLF